MKARVLRRSRTLKSNSETYLGLERFAKKTPTQTREPSAALGDLCERHGFGQVGQAPQRLLLPLGQGRRRPRTAARSLRPRRAAPRRAHLRRARSAESQRWLLHFGVSRTPHFCTRADAGRSPRYFHFGASLSLVCVRARAQGRRAGGLERARGRRRGRARAERSIATHLEFPRHRSTHLKISLEFAKSGREGLRFGKIGSFQRRARSRGFPRNTLSSLETRLRHTRSNPTRNPKIRNF